MYARSKMQVDSKFCEKFAYHLNFEQEPVSLKVRVRVPGLRRWGNRVAVSGHGHRRRRRWRAGEHQAPSHVRPVLSCTPRSVLGIEFFVKPATIANRAFVSGDLNEITITLAWFELLSPGRGPAPLSCSCV